MTYFFTLFHSFSIKILKLSANDLSIIQRTTTFVSSRCYSVLLSTFCLVLYVYVFFIHCLIYSAFCFFLFIELLLLNEHYSYVSRYYQPWMNSALHLQYTLLHFYCSSYVIKTKCSPITWNYSKCSNSRSNRPVSFGQSIDSCGCVAYY